MHIPRFWSKGDFHETYRGRHPQTGKKIPVSCWGWSDESLEEAREMGTRRVQQLVDLLRSGSHPGRYPYGSIRPLKEEILQEWERDGEAYLIKTRNAYGCEVLNTADVMFVDVDIVIPEGWECRSFERRSWWHGLTGWGSPPEPPFELGEEEIERRLRLLLDKEPHLRVRVYRTLAGYRYLFVHGHEDPSSDLTEGYMEALGADDMYRRLCRNQKCFRARLTPKPWRAGFHALKAPYPVETDGQATARAEWVAAYGDVIPRHATCRFIEELGRGQGLGPETSQTITEVVRLHDEATGALSERPLA